MLALKYSGRIRTVFTRHEQAASFMACGYGGRVILDALDSPAQRRRVHGCIPQVSQRVVEQAHGNRATGHVERCYVVAGQKSAIASAEASVTRRRPGSPWMPTPSSISSSPRVNVGFPAAGTVHDVSATPIERV